MNAASVNIGREDYEAQLADGFRSLTFTPPLERAFRADRRERIIPQLRVMLLLGFAFGLSILAMDWFAQGPGFSSPMIPKRGLATQLPVLLLFLATFVPAARRWLGPLAAFAGLNIAVTSLMWTPIAQLQNIGTPVTGLITLSFYVYLFLGLRFWPATVTAISIFLITMAFYIARDATGSTLVYNGLFLLFANLIGMAGAYNVEYHARLAYLEARLLEHMASTDHLTGLANREQFDAYLDELWRHCARNGEPLALALLDVDYFKNYNDAYGHQAGDACLARIAQVIAESKRRPLDFAARYGGEEFVLLLPGATADHAHLLLSKIISRVESLNITHDNSACSSRVTISAGVAEVRPQETERSAQGLLQLADEALYRAKRKGRNRVIVARPEREDSLLTGIFSRTAGGTVRRTA